jgi:hypothetical protein
MLPPARCKLGFLAACVCGRFFLGWFMGIKRFISGYPVSFLEWLLFLPPLDRVFCWVKQRRGRVDNILWNLWLRDLWPESEHLWGHALGYPTEDVDSDAPADKDADPLGR